MGPHEKTAPHLAVPRQPSAAVLLPPIDVASIQREDHARAGSPEKHAPRIGVFRDLPEPVVLSGAQASDGAWQHAGGGWAWSVQVCSPGARALRLHFERLNLPEGARLAVYNPDKPAERYGPVTGPGPVWAPTCFGEVAAIEVFASNAAARRAIDISLDRLVHVYAGFGVLNKAAKSAQPCNNDVTCYPEWFSTSTGVAGIGTIGNDGMLWCTGSLVADTDPNSDIPYFLTANHCVPTQSSADTLEFYWLYQTPVCDGSPPDPASVPRTTGGADLLITATADAGTDFCLLEMRNPPPPSTAFVGWAADEETVGSNVTGIHHPSGDFKRISFGQITNFDEVLLADRPRTRYHQVLWSDGTTEGGSSGSPILRMPEQLIVGQLWGGLASCSSMGSPDYYGRFDMTFPLVQPWLNPTGSDIEADFGAAEYTVSESAGHATLDVVLSQAPGSGVTVSVDYETLAGTATPGQDYVHASGTLEFTGLETEATFTVDLIDDTTYETQEDLTVMLSNPNGVSLEGANNPAFLRINSDDADGDGDRISDYDEINGTLGYVTDPTRYDTDGDGANDLLEINTGHDPTDNADFPPLSGIRVPWFETIPKPATGLPSAPGR